MSVYTGWPWPTCWGRSTLTLSWTSATTAGQTTGIRKLSWTSATTAGQTTGIRKLTWTSATTAGQTTGIRKLAWTSATSSGQTTGIRIMSWTSATSSGQTTGTGIRIMSWTSATSSVRRTGITICFAQRTSVGDPKTLNLDEDSECCPNLDPDAGLCCKFFRFCLGSGLMIASRYPILEAEFTPFTHKKEPEPLQLP